MSEEKADRRDELHEPDQAEPERAAGQRVHLPADRDDLHLQRDRRCDPHVEEADKGGVAQSEVGGNRLASLQSDCGYAVSPSAKLSTEMTAAGLRCFEHGAATFAAIRLACQPKRPWPRRLVEPRGVEPLTSSLRTRRSPN